MQEWKERDKIEISLGMGHNMKIIEVEVRMIH